MQCDYPDRIHKDVEYDHLQDTGVVSCGFSVSELLKNLGQVMTCLHLIKQPEVNIPVWHVYFCLLVEPGGIEPPTSCVQSRRSPS